MENTYTEPDPTPPHGLPRVRMLVETYTVTVDGVMVNEHGTPIGRPYETTIDAASDAAKAFAVSMRILEVSELDNQGRMRVYRRPQR